MSRTASPSPQIRVLADAVASQIAAGEVVERPASVVKELVENALDADARKIRIELAGGGKQRIRVSDDGWGMNREDALLSLDRHATSKIVQASDLVAVRTFGFRGEALPSILSVADMVLETSDSADAVGTRIVGRGGRIIDVSDVARQRGTTVEVRRLFFNAPARAKFLKSASAETRAVTDALTPLVLVNTAVEIEVVSGDRSLIHAPASAQLPQRLAALWGGDVASGLLPIQGTDGGYEVKGLIQRPDLARPGFRRVHLFVNGRPIRDRALTRAADRGFRTTIAQGVRPWLFLFLEMPGGQVDVNVHPSKLEVRFRDAAKVEALVEEAVRSGLATHASAAVIGDAIAPEGVASPERVPEATGSAYPTADEKPGTAPRQVREQIGLFVSEGSPEAADTDRAGPSAPPPVPGRSAHVWQALNTYIFLEMRDEVLIIDQHSAHERVLFQRIMDAFAGTGEVSQKLLFPLTLRLTPLEAEQVQSLAGLLAKAGFEVEGFGGDTVIVHSVPNPHPYFDAERCLREMIRELTEGSELVRAAHNQHERIAMTFACKGAIKAGQALEVREMRELIDQLFATELPHHDVHGRPTVVRLSSAELGRRFGRT